jgi:hypothetical protein
MIERICVNFLNILINFINLYTQYIDNFSTSIRHPTNRYPTETAASAFRSNEQGSKGWEPHGTHQYSKRIGDRPGAPPSRSVATGAIRPSPRARSSPRPRRRLRKPRNRLLLPSSRLLGNRAGTTSASAASSRGRRPLRPGGGAGPPHFPSHPWPWLTIRLLQLRPRRIYA